MEGVADISVGMSAVVGLCDDGKVITAGIEETVRKKIEGWTDIVAVKVFGSSYVLGLKQDGTIVCGYDSNPFENKVKLFENFETIEQERENIKKKYIKRIKEEKAERERQKKIRQEEAARKEAERLRAIKEHNDALQEKIDVLEKQFQEQKVIYEVNQGKIFGAGAKLKKAAKVEMDRLESEIRSLNSKKK